MFSVFGCYGALKLASLRAGAVLGMRVEGEPGLRFRLILFTIYCGFRPGVCFLWLNYCAGQSARCRIEPQKHHEEGRSTQMLLMQPRLDVRGDTWLCSCAALPGIQTRPNPKTRNSWSWRFTMFSG